MLHILQKLASQADFDLINSSQKGLSYKNKIQHDDEKQTATVF